MDFIYTIIGAVVGTLIYRSGIAMGRDITEGNKVTPPSIIKSVISRITPKDTKKDNAMSYEKAWENILAYDGTPQKKPEDNK